MKVTHLLKKIKEAFWTSSLTCGRREKTNDLHGSREFFQVWGQTEWFLIRTSKSPFKEVLLCWKHPIFRCKMWIIHVIRETGSTKISCCDTRSQKVKSDDRSTVRAQSNLLLCSRVKWWWGAHLRPSTWWVLMQSRPLSSPSTLAQSKRICPALCTTKPAFV